MGNEPIILDKIKTPGADGKPPQALIEFMSSGWAGEPFVAEIPLVVSIHPQVARFHSRREQLSRAFPGEYLVIASGNEQVRANDTNFRFRPSSDFAYLVGGGEPGALLVLEPIGSSHRSLLFVPEHNRGAAEFFTHTVYGEVWGVRHHRVAERTLYYGV